MKVLVISHNVFSRNSSMGRTLANFFTGISKDNIAQLYFHTEIPTTTICTNYFRITDFDNFKFERNIGNIYKEDDIKQEMKSSRVDSGNKNRIYNIGKKRKPYMYIGRNLIWSTKKWWNKKLIDWINDFNPEIIFFASGDYVFAYKIAMQIAKYKKIPILTYVCDDYYFFRKKSISPLYHINKISYDHTLRELLNKHKNMIGICDKLSRDYAKEFDVESTTIMTSSDLKKIEKDKEEKAITISYIGNMGYNRHKMLKDIGNTLNEISKEVCLDVYSGETRDSIINELKGSDGIRYNGSISYDDVIDVMANSDILVHVEAMDPESRNKVRYSISTKIADSLTMGKCILAYGPEDVASIEYLKENDCACVVTSKGELKNKLKELVENCNLRNQYGDKGNKVAMKNHNFELNGECIKKLLFKIANKNFD